MPGISYSTGSSMVRILRVGSLRIDSHGGKRRGLAAARQSPGDHDHAVRHREQPRHRVLVARAEPELAHLQQPAVARQQADHGALSHVASAWSRRGRRVRLRPTRTRAAPSWGMRRSAMSRLARILMREISACGGIPCRRRQRAEGRRHACAPRKPGAERLDVNVAGAQVHPRAPAGRWSARTTGAPLARSRRLSMSSSDCCPTLRTPSSPPSYRPLQCVDRAPW